MHYIWKNPDTHCLKDSIKMRFHDQCKLWEKGHIRLTCLEPPSTACIHTKAAPGGKSWCRSYGAVLPTALLQTACSACFLTEYKTTQSRGHTTPNWFGPSQYHYLENALWTYHSQLLWKHFLSPGSLLLDDFSLSQVHMTSEYNVT